MDINKICSQLEFNIKEEASAREFYFELLENIKEEDKELIRGIISDEINHSIILSKLVEKYSHILPSEFYPFNSLKKKEN